MVELESTTPLTDSHLQETISMRLPSLLREMERHNLTANIAMCEIFIRRAQDYQSLLRVFVSSFAQSGFAGAETLMPELQGLLNALENRRACHSFRTGERRFANSGYQ